jgi:hypothetical protein
LEVPISARAGPYGAIRQGQNRSLLGQIADIAQIARQPARPRAGDDGHGVPWIGNPLALRRLGGRDWVCRFAAQQGFEQFIQQRPVSVKNVL